MRWFIGTLIAVNLAILLWGWLGGDEQPEGELAAPGVGTIRLMGEPPATAEPQAVPIPAPPRHTGDMAQAEPAASGAAAVAPAKVADTPELQPLSEPAPIAEAEPVTAAPEPAESPAAQLADATPMVSVPEPEYVPEPEVVAPAAKPVCASIGPFANAAAAKATRGYLQGLGKVDSHQQTGQQRVGYWVLVPPQASRAAAESIAAQLKAKGIKDYWIVSKGEVKNGISLGVFSQKDNADAFIKRARAKGFTVELREKTKPVEQLWLDYRGNKPVTPAELGSRAPAGVRVESQGCPATGVRG